MPLLSRLLTLLVILTMPLFLARFFFQAEDGIRDWSVTGVQTCALPISSANGARLASARAVGRRMDHGRAARAARHGPRVRLLRSEERRVGKECNCGQWT